MIEWCKRSPDIWDVIIIGGGATGLGAAVDSAARGYKTLLLEQNDFAKGTSSRSTKLIHGGLRYLKQGNIALVMEALKERGLLFENAPHLISHLPFLIPHYKWWEKPFYGIGMKVYDLLAGHLGIEKSHTMSREETLEKLPTLISKNLVGGTIYYDGQFDDARLAINLAQTAADLDATLLNYMPVVSLIKKQGRVVGVEAIDLETNEPYQLHAKVVINATGAFTDGIRKLDDPKATSIIEPSQGIHLVLDRSFLPSDYAILIPATSDGRVLFFVPWHNHLLVGTTDTPVNTTPLEPRPLSEEIDFLLNYATQYLTRKPKRSDVFSVFAGLRPLVRAGKGKSTASLSRSHFIQVADSGLITICGGKWTTYRKMGEDVIEKAISVGDLEKKPCQTESLKLHGYMQGTHTTVDAWTLYGSNGTHLQALVKEHPEWGEKLHARLPYTPVEVIWAVRKEMARTLEDVLSRRTRALLLDVRAALEIAPKVAHLMAKELGKPDSWEKEQIEAFTMIASGYLPS